MSYYFLYTNATNELEPSLNQLQFTAVSIDAANWKARKALKMPT